MSLQFEEIMAALEKEVLNYTQQQAKAHEAYHHCAGAIAYIKAKMQDLDKHEKDIKAKLETETPVKELVDA